MQDFDYNIVGAGYYDEILHDGNPVRSFWHKYEFAQIVSQIEPNPNGAILDVGCAAGSFLGTLKIPYRLAIGIDLSEAQIDYATRKYGSDSLQFFCGDIRKADFEDEMFDTIVLSEIVEHISYDESLEMLKKIKTFLKPDGRLIVTTPNYRSIWPYLEWVVNRVSPVSYEHQHINKLNLPTFVNLIRKAGYKVMNRNSFFITGPFTAVISRPFARAVCRIESRLLPSFGCLLLVTATKR